MRRRSRLVAVPLALGLVLTGCGGGGDDEDDSSGGAAAPAGEVDRDATLRVAWTIGPSGLDPHVTPSTIAQYGYVTPIYDRLTQIVEGPELQPMLATEWEVAEDGLSWTFTLRDDVTFSDGTQFDANAVKASFERALTLPESTVKNELSMIESVEVVDPTTVTINTTRPAGDLPYVLAFSPASIISPEALDNPDLDRNPVGSGPYTLAEVQIGQSATYERREGYWDEEAQQAATIEMSAITDDNARLSALRSGQVDMIVTKIGQYDQASQLGADFELHSYPKAATYALYLNTNRPGLDDVAVRQALNFAVDRETINETLLDGQCDPIGQPLTETFAGHLEDPPIEYTYDPERARELLEEAGFADGLSIGMLVGAGLAPQIDLAPVLQAQFGEVGIDAEVITQDPVQVNATYSQGQNDAYIQTRVSGANGAITLRDNYLNPRRTPGTPPAELVEALNSAFDPALSEDEVTEAMETASTVVVEEALDVFICALPTQVTASTNVIGADTMGVAFFQGIPDLRYVGIARN